MSCSLLNIALRQNIFTGRRGFSFSCMDSKKDRFIMQWHRLIVCHAVHLFYFLKRVLRSKDEMLIVAVFKFMGNFHKISEVSLFTLDVHFR